MKQQFPGLVFGFLLGVLVGIALIENLEQQLWCTWWWPEVRGVLLLHPGPPPEC